MNKKSNINLIEFNLELDLPFSNSPTNDKIIFSKFLPRMKEAIEIRENDFEIKLYFSYNYEDIDSINYQILKSQKKIKEQMNIYVKSLKLEIRTFITPQLYHELGNQEYNNNTLKFLKKISDQSIDLYDNIFNYLRNIKKQTWLKKIYFDRKNFQQFLLQSNAVWIYKNNRQRLSLKEQRTELVIDLDDSFFTGEKYVSKNDWDNLSVFLKENNKIKSEDFFIANSLEHLESKNYRIAIIEIVIALEHFIKNNKCKNIESFLQNEEFIYLKKLFIKKQEFSIPMEIMLYKLNKKLVKKDISPDMILEIIKIRNEIMHNGSKVIEKYKSKKLVRNVIKFIEFIKRK